MQKRPNGRFCFAGWAECSARHHMNGCAAHFLAVGIDLGHADFGQSGTVIGQDGCEGLMVHKDGFENLFTGDDLAVFGEIVAPNQQTAVFHIGRVDADLACAEGDAAGGIGAAFAIGILLAEEQVILKGLEFFHVFAAVVGEGIGLMELGHNAVGDAQLAEDFGAEAIGLQIGGIELRTIVIPEDIAKPEEEEMETLMVDIQKAIEEAWMVAITHMVTAAMIQKSI